MQKIIDTLVAACQAAMLACLLAALFGIVTVDAHLHGWCKGGDNIQARAQLVTGHAESLTAHTDLLVATARKKVAALDVRPLNATLRNVQAATGDAAAVAADVRGSLPKIHKGTFLLWDHVDRAILAVDHSTFIEGEQQTLLANQSLLTLQDSDKAVEDLDKLITDPKITLAVSHVEGLTASLDSTGKHVNHVAAHYDKLLTAPKRWYQTLRDDAEAGAIWAARHL